jgi:hypothetical protein
VPIDAGMPRVSFVYAIVSIFWNFEPPRQVFHVRNGTGRARGYSKGVSPLRILGLVAATALLAVSALPAVAQQEGPRTSVTIYKAPPRSFLTQGNYVRARTYRALEGTAAYQPAWPTDGIAGYGRYPLPDSWTFPGIR